MWSMRSRGQLEGGRCANPQVILFIGGHLSGVSPTGFITSFTDQFKGARSTARKHGQAGRL